HGESRDFRDRPCRFGEVLARLARQHAREVLIERTVVEDHQRPSKLGGESGRVRRERRATTVWRRGRRWYERADPDELLGAIESDGRFASGHLDECKGLRQVLCEGGK